jgi:predicted nuclease of predicted toxin-antitoxin system
MKLLLDQGLPRSATALLTAQGLDVAHVGEVGASAAADADIIQLAEREGRVIVTLDADFHALLALAGASLPSVVRIRIEGLKGVEVARLIVEVLRRCKDELEAGALVSVQPNRVRIRRLPLVPPP